MAESHGGGKQQIHTGILAPGDILEKAWQRCGQQSPARAPGLSLPGQLEVLISRPGG